MAANHETDVLGIKESTSRLLADCLRRRGLAYAERSVDPDDHQTDTSCAKSPLVCSDRVDESPGCQSIVG